jgi:hypothetical protein
VTHRVNLAVLLLVVTFSCNSAVATVHEFWCDGSQFGSFDGVADGDTIIYGGGLCSVCYVDFPPNMDLVISAYIYEDFQGNPIYDYVEFYNDLPCHAGGNPTEFTDLTSDQNSVFNGLRFSGYRRVFGLYNCSAVFNDCYFLENGYTGDSPIEIHGGAPEFNNCTFYCNFSTYYEDEYVTLNGGFGSAVLVSGGATPVFNNCVFENNRATFGGTICHSFDSVVTLIDCTFTNNSPGDPLEILDGYTDYRACCLTGTDCIVKDLPTCKYRFGGIWRSEFAGCSNPDPCDSPVEPISWGHVKSLFIK